MAGAAAAWSASHCQLPFKRRRDIASLVEKIMKTRTFVLVIATAVAIASGPQLAHACYGDACTSVSFTGGSTVTNAHRTRAVVIGLCPLQARGDCGPSPRIEELKLQPMERKELPQGLRNVEMRTAKFMPDLSTTGPKPADKAPGDKALVDKVTVTNGGQVPLKVVILDMGKVDIGRTPNYETGSVDIKLNRGVAKYHWEAFTPGAVEPCQVVHDETRSAITAQCQRPQPKLPAAAKIAGESDAAWEENSKKSQHEIDEATKRIFGNWATAVAPLFTDRSRTIEDIHAGAARASALMKAQLHAIACHDAAAAIMGTRANTAAATKELDENFTGYAFVIDCNANKIDFTYDFSKLKRKGT
jgi:hypothetical protein